MTWSLTILALCLLVLPLAISIRRSTELFRVVVRDGKAIFVRGRMPQSLLHDLDDIVGSSPLARAELRAIRRDGKAQLEIKGELSAEQCQRLRNAVGMYSMQRIRAGQGPKRRPR